MVLNAKDGILIVALVALDQITKAIARSMQPDNFIFQLAHNTGAGFGILQGKNALLLVISLIVLVLLAKPIATSSGREKTAYLCLAAGIVGNSIDRVMLGGVTDFISIGSFPVFNVADSLITLSILYLIARNMKASFSSWNYKKKNRRQT